MYNTRCTSPPPTHHARLSKEMSRGRGYASRKHAYFKTTLRLQIVSTLSIMSNALIRSMSKLIIGTEDGLRIGKGSLLVSCVGEWLLLLVSLWCLERLVLDVLNSWLLLIPGVSFRLLTSRSISWSSIDSVEDGELGFWLESWSILWLGDLIGDLPGDLSPPFAALDWLMR